VSHTGQLGRFLWLDSRRFPPDASVHVVINRSLDLLMRRHPALLVQQRAVCFIKHNSPSISMLCFLAGKAYPLIRRIADSPIQHTALRTFQPSLEPNIAIEFLVRFSEKRDFSSSGQNIADLSVTAWLFAHIEVVRGHILDLRDGIYYWTFNWHYP